MTSPAPPLRPGFKEFVAIIAGLMMINALGIDIMLPALPAMGDALHIAVENQRQFIIAGYVLGFGAAQVVYGPLADRYGRKPVLIGSLLLYVVMSLFATFAIDLHTIVAARVLQGIGAAASRVLAISVVRDRYVGRQMARVSSLAFMVFLAVPVLAPSVGQMILLVGPWKWIFYFLAGFALLLVIWAGLRLPETLDPAFRRPLSPREIVGGFREVVTNRIAIGYTFASALMFGSLMGYINTVQQVFAETFGRADLMTLVFAMSAMGMAASALLNARIVGRLGTRRVSQSALFGFIAVSFVHLVIVLSGHETIVSFAILQSAILFCFGLAASNFGAMAMEPMGHIAGTAASVQGMVSSVGGALIGLAIGQAFDGTTRPIALGYLLCGLAALGIVMWVERGRLFVPHHAAVG